MIKCGDGASGETQWLSAFGGKRPSGETRLHFLPVGKKIEVPLRPAAAGNSPPDCCIGFFKSLSHGDKNNPHPLRMRIIFGGVRGI